MNKAILQALTDWNRATNERQKLQHTYISATVILLVVAGLISLISYEIGQRLLIVAIAALFLFIANAIVWAMVYTFVVMRIAARSLAKKAAKATASRTK